MKKITKYKEIQADVETFKRLPIKCCRPFNTSNMVEDTLVAIGTKATDGKDLFYFKNFTSPYCAEVITRYPRDVPEGIPKLPDNKPQWAYLGRGGDWLTEKSVNIGRKGLVGAHNPGYNDEWRECEASHVHLVGFYEDYHYVVDVSDKWVQKTFPEIVEAMEYKPVYRPGYDNEGACHVVGHRLGKKRYDLNWNLIRDKPEHTEYKYNTVEDYLRAMGHSAADNELNEAAFATLKVAFKAARESKGANNEK